MTAEEEKALKDNNMLIGKNNVITVGSAIALMVFRARQMKAVILIVCLFCLAAVPTAAEVEITTEVMWRVVDPAGNLIDEHREEKEALETAVNWSEANGATARVIGATWRVRWEPSDEEPDDPVTDPPSEEVPTRSPSPAIKNRNASNFTVISPTREVGGQVVHAPGGWFDVWDRRDEMLPFSVSNGIIAGYGGKGGSWGHGVYAHHVTLNLQDVWIYGPTRREQLGRDHPLYLSGTDFTADGLLIGHWDDKFPHTIDLNITRGDNGPQPCDIGTMVVIGGWRVVIEADDNSLSSLHIDRLIVIDPVTADGLWEGIEVKGCPDIQISEYIVIDREGRWREGALMKAQDSSGEIGRAIIYAPNAPPQGLIRGIEGSVTRLTEGPAGEPPEVTGPESIPQLVDWATHR